MLALIVVCTLAFVAAACGGGSSDDTNPKPLGPNPTSTDPGPNPTNYDPGPNNTTNGPVTLDGTLQVTPQCLTLQRPQGPLDLHFTNYKGQGTNLVDMSGHAIASNGDEIAVAGHVANAHNACGERFNVDSLVTVIPK
jgi:hypothetical protein